MIRRVRLKGHYSLCLGDNLKSLKHLEDNSVDCVVTDPPYGLGKEPDAMQMLRQWVKRGHHDHSGKSGFMGRKWDAFVPQPALWKEVYRVLKPGGHILSFFGSRTFDIGTLAMRLAGFQIRDTIMWVHGQGFPKSQDVGKQIDRSKGKKLKVVGRRKHPTLKDSTKVNRQGSHQYHGQNSIKDEWDIEVPVTREGKKWLGWGTSLKPAVEPIVLARKPLEGSVAMNVLKWGTGGINISKSRVPMDGDVGGGRFPANLIHDGSEQVLALFPRAGGGHQARTKVTGFGKFGSGSATYAGPGAKMDGMGNAGRFFYCAKANQKDRHTYQHKNLHPTVKPTDLMRYLISLVCPPGGTILDPFMGSGSTGKAAVLSGFNFIGMELESDSFETALHRIRHCYEQIYGAVST